VPLTGEVGCAPVSGRLKLATVSTVLYVYELNVPVSGLPTLTAAA
jgi:hypothetical protein